MNTQEIILIFLLSVVLFFFSLSNNTANTTIHFYMWLKTCVHHLQRKHKAAAVPILTVFVWVWRHVFKSHSIELVARFHLIRQKNLPPLFKCSHSFMNDVCKTKVGKVSKQASEQAIECDKIFFSPERVKLFSFLSLSVVCHHCWLSQSLSHSNTQKQNQF